MSSPIDRTAYARGRAAFGAGGSLRAPAQSGAESDEEALSFALGYVDALVDLLRERRER